MHNGQLHTFTWNASNELEAVTHNRRTRTRYWYDPLGRRIAKHTEAVDWRYTHDPVRLRRLQAQRATEEGLGTVLYGWDGDQLAWETDFVRRQTVHYVHEPDGFVPILQAVSAIPDAMLRRPAEPATAYEGPEGYDMDRDPLHNGSWHPGLDRNGELKTPLQQLYFYQCDHLGTPQELTDEHGEIAWEAHYKAWGEARLTISEAARKAKLVNPIRFQGQYFDEESGLHYNRFRYYDPHAGRFISKDPIGLLGGLNTHAYAPNPTQWTDPAGLNAARDLPQMKGMSIPHAQKALTKSGFSKTKDNGINQTWNHPDGSEVRVHKYGNQKPCGFKSGNNAHIHKEDPSGNQMNDIGIISNDKNETHIGIKNPKDLPTVRGRSHGCGS